MFEVKQSLETQMSETHLSESQISRGGELDLEGKNWIWRRFGRNASINVVGAGFATCAKLAQAILLTKFLQLDDYGRILIITNLFVFLDSFLGLRVSDVVFRFFQPLKEANDSAGVRKLLLICTGICLTSSLVIYLGILGFSGWLANNVYSDSSLSDLFRIFGPTVLVSSFSGIYEPILRLYDRFYVIVLPQVFGLITLGILGSYFARIGNTSYDLKVVVTALLIGVLVQCVPPLIKTAQLLKPFFAKRKATQANIDFTSDLIPFFFHSNLSGYLKFAISPGDIFLLGVFSSPSQVALYGLAKQLTAPFAIVQTTIQTAITPEIVLLRTRNRLKQLEHLIKRYVVCVGLLGGLFLVLALIIGFLIFSTFFSAQYANALPIFYILVTAAWLLLVMAVFRPLAITLDMLKWHNAALSISVLLIILLLAVNRLSAINMAFVQLIEAALLRSVFSFVVWSGLRTVARQSLSSRQSG